MSLGINGLGPVILERLLGLSREDREKNKVEEAKKGYIELYGKELSKGLIILKKPDNEAVSEGIGFGAVITVESNSKECQESFWNLYKGRKAYFLKSSNVMAWKTNSSGTVTGKDTASDGDGDYLGAALKALKKLKSGEWKIPEGMSIATFEKEIQNDLAAFWKAHVKKTNGRYFYLASDGSWAKRGDNREIYYASYPDPHFLRMSTEVDQAHDWEKLADDVQDLNAEILKNYKELGAAGQNPMPAKVFVTIKSDGSYKLENYYTVSKKEGTRGEALKDNEMDSIRFLLRQARTAILDNDPKAKAILKDLLKFAKIDIQNPYSAHILAGAKDAPHKMGWANTLARASYGVAVLAVHGKPAAKAFFNTVFANYQKKFFGEWDGAKDYYYDQSLIIQILDLYVNIK